MPEPSESHFSAADWQRHREAEAAAEEKASLLGAFILELGRGLSLAGTAVSETQDRLMTVAEANGAPDARVVVLPTTLIVSLGQAQRATLELVPQRTGALRLDQISALYEVVKRAERGEIAPKAGLDELRAVRDMKPRFGHVLSIIGHALMTVGLCLLLDPTFADVVAAACFGVLVGGFMALAKGWPTLSVLVPVLAAAMVSALTFVAVDHGIADLGMPVLIAPLVTFLPGAALTTATVELAYGEMVAGASRLVFGGLQLLLLAFGIAAGANIAGVPRAELAQAARSETLGWWAPWLGVLLFGVATALYFSAPRGATRWLLLVLLVAWVGQLVGNELVGPTASGFVGAFVMTPVALAVARFPSGPPSQVTFLPAFWMLVPGALGLIGITELIGDLAGSSLNNLVQPIASIVAIALGVLCGVSTFRTLMGSPREIRRLGSRLRAEVWRSDR